MRHKFDNQFMLAILKIAEKVPLAMNLTAIYFLDCFYLERDTGETEWGKETG